MKHDFRLRSASYAVTSRRSPAKDKIPIPAANCRVFWNVTEILRMPVSLSLKKVLDNFSKDFLRTTDKGYTGFADARASFQKCSRKLKSIILAGGTCTTVNNGILGS